VTDAQYPKVPPATAQPVAAIRRAVQALNDGDLDGYLRHFDASCHRWIVGYEQPLSLADVEAGFRDLDTAFDGLRLDEDLLFGDRRFACARWRMRGIHQHDYLGLAPTGRPIDVETCEVYEVIQGRVMTSWVYGDVLGQLVAQITPEGPGT
jgi:predicted ester cyclase